MIKCLKNLTANSPIRPSTLLAGPSLPTSECTYFMDDPKVIQNKEISKINTFFFTKFVYESLFCGILKKISQMRI